MSKMKKLEELGISPAPWKVDDRKWGCDNEIRCEYISDIIVKGEKRTRVVASCNAHFDTYKPDASIISAAPELYECLREEFEKVCTNDGKCTDCQFVGQCRVKKWRTALAKASGEDK